MFISINQACLLWDKLRDARDGKASHGHEAEIYAYTLMESYPGMDMHSEKYNTEFTRAAESLVSIIELFNEQYPDYQIFINNENYHVWLKNIQSEFRHRVMVSIIQKTGE